MVRPVEFIWMDGRLVPWNEAYVHVLTYTLHYGAGVFEGIKLYNTVRGPAIFRLDEHIDRLFDSFFVFGRSMPFSKDEITQAIVETIKANDIAEGYIRPLVYFGTGQMRLDITDSPIRVVIAMWPWERHLGGGAVRAKTSSFIRLDPRSTYVDKKIVGHYINSILAHMEAKRAGYDEALLLDYQGNVAEGAAENVFMVKNGMLYTPPLGTILPGITRDSVIVIAQKELGISVNEEVIMLDDLYGADEAFFTGTATEISPISSIDDKRFLYDNYGVVTKRIIDCYAEILMGKSEKFDAWLTFV